MSKEIKDQSVNLRIEKSLMKDVEKYTNKIENKMGVRLTTGQVIRLLIRRGLNSE